MNQASRFQPALIGGLVIGVLSALPIISLGNCCCCLWVVAGGVAAAWIMQGNQRSAITIGDGATVGLLAGVIGAFVMLVLSIPISITLGPFQDRLIERLLQSSSDLPPALRDAFERTRGGQGPVALFIGFIVQLMVGSVVATIGGILGALMFRKETAPAGTEPPPIPSGDYQPPSGSY